MEPCGTAQQSQADTCQSRIRDKKATQALYTTSQNATSITVQDNLHMGHGLCVVHHSIRHLISDVAVARDAVCADDHGRDVSVAHEGGGHGVGDERGRDAVVHKLVCGQARTLVVRPRLSAVHMINLAVCSNVAYVRIAADAYITPPSSSRNGSSIPQ